MYVLRVRSCKSTLVKKSLLKPFTDEAQTALFKDPVRIAL